jgi:peptidoglycan/LPS O-acetylase OafA/YrhL
VLSGLVLSLSLSRSAVDVLGYVRFGIRRIFRLLPLLWAAVAIGGFYLFQLDARMPMSFADLGPLDIPKFVSGFIGCSLKPGPPAWSIFVELVISLLLPAMWIIFNGPMKWALVFGRAAASGVVLTTSLEFFSGGHVDHLPGAIEWGVWAIGYSG